MVSCEDFAEGKRVNSSENKVQVMISTVREKKMKKKEGLLS